MLSQTELSADGSEQEKLPRRRGAKAVRFDDKGIHDRERKKQNLALSPSKRRRPGRPKKSNVRKYERRRELEKEKELVEELSAARLNDNEAQSKLVAAANIKVVRKAFAGAPLLTKPTTTASVEEMAKLHENSRKIFRGLKQSAKKEFAATLTSQLSTSTSASVLGVSERTILRYRAKQLTREDRKARFSMELSEDDEDTAPGYDKETVADLEAKLYIKFFEDNTGVLSGSVRNTRVLTIAKFELVGRLFGEFPSLLRQLNKEHPGLLSSLPEKSRLRVAMEAAVAAKGMPGFNEAVECARRTDMARQRYREKLKRKRRRSNKSILPARVNKMAPDLGKELSAEEQAREDLIQPIAYRKFFEVIKAAKIRWTKKNKPYNCPLHEKGPRWELKESALSTEQKEVEDQIAALKQARETSAQPWTNEQKAENGKLGVRLIQLRGKLRDLKKKIALYRLHMRQFEKCRLQVEALERDLPVGEAVLYRDFVNQYTSSGKKMGNLQLVILFRKAEGMPLTQIKVYNYSGGDSGVTCDPYFVHDVMDFHMKPVEQGGSGILRNFTLIHVSGDHGSHFSATKTVYNESRMFERYGLKVHIISLCSYHCYNRCDAAGLVGKNLAASAAKEGKELRTSQDYAQGTMHSGSPETLAYDFESINRSEEVFAEAIVSGSKEIGETLRKMCEIEYEVLVEDQVTKLMRKTYITGVGKCRAVPLEGAWSVFDLRESMQNVFCHTCSNRQAGPVYHAEGHQTCTVIKDAQEPAFLSLINQAATPQDDPERMRMLQDRQVEKRTAIVASNKEFPCKFCLKTKRYAWGYSANAHMQKEHPELIREGSLYPDDHAAQKEAVRRRAAAKLPKVVEEPQEPSEARVEAATNALAPAFGTIAMEPESLPRETGNADAREEKDAFDCWVCPCSKTSGHLVPSGTKLTGNNSRTGRAFWVCDVVADHCTDGKATEVTVLAVLLHKVEQKKKVRGAWVNFVGHTGGEPEVPAPLPLIDYASVVGDVCENEVLIYNTTDGLRVGCVVGVYDEVDPPSVEVHRYGTYEARGDVLRGTLKPAYVDMVSEKFKFVVKANKTKYYPVLDDVYAEGILARDVQLDNWIVPHAVAAQVASSQALPSNLTTRVASPAAFWYQEDLLYRTKEAASKALQDTIVEPPDAQSHVVITVPRTSSLALSGVAPAPANEYELFREKHIAENAAKLKALLSIFDTGSVPEGAKRGRKRSATDEDYSSPKK